MKADNATLPSNALSITLNATFSAKDTLNLAKRNFFSKESPRQTWTYGTRREERENGSMCRNTLHRRMRYRVPPNTSLSRPTFYARGCAWTAAHGRPLPPPAHMRARVRLHSNVTIGDIYARPSARKGAPCADCYSASFFRPALLRARVRRQVLLTNMSAAYMGVNLGGGDIGMPQDFLNGAQVRPSL